MKHILLAGLVSLGLASSAQAGILTGANPTFNLFQAPPISGSTHMNIAYHAGFNQYYGGIGGSPDFTAFVWSAAGGAPIQVIQPNNADIRAFNYNSNTNALELITYNAQSGNGGGDRGLLTVGLDGAGLLTGSHTNTLASLPGLNGVQTMPAYDAAQNQFYSRDNGGTVNVVSRVDGTLSGTINLDLAAAGSPLLQSYTLGFDETQNALIAIDYLNAQALVFDLSGNFLGASQLTGFAGSIPNAYNTGYTNGQLFVYDGQIEAWRGYEIFSNMAVVPEPSTFALLGIGGLALVGYGWRRKRQQAA
ncbi:PEP-CTERM motif protein [Symmachiella macrocystis]|uniref:PEP-CTERM motif protein n=1 Tax=Symmachiella macrocystis TaxID=2527985 RepID=A0A5C6BCJ9_9PLAN|nr:PEP-CTERM sorting domain-containing protein [Symmachiella macrocystis]TWU09442.1 PEP-CTERM motif protein [Symmachiella macrocystis]